MSFELLMKLRPVYRYCFLSVLLVIALTLPAQAAVPGWYAKVDGGANLLAGTGADIGGESGHLAFDSGFRVDAILGYELNHWLAFEVEGGWIENTISSVTLHQQQEHLPDSSLNEVPLLGNAILRYENDSPFVPYVGIGAGGLMSKLQISGDKDTDIEFAYQAKIGLIYKLEEQAWIDIGYKLLVSVEQKYQLGGAAVRTDEIFNHFIGGSVTWRF
jgi:opacity protein-like surface antigen